MQQDTIHFDSDGGVRLTGVLDRPADHDPRGYVLFAHCFAGAGNLEAALDISQHLCGQGFGVLRLDAAAPGQGEREHVLASARFLEREHAAPTVLIGHSTGGEALLHTAPEMSSARALATIGVLVDASQQDTLRAQGRELLILHCPADSAAGAGVVLAAWAARYLAPVAAADIDYDEPVIARIGASGLRTEMEAGGLPLVADEPRKLGGTATGPTPYGYLSAALASCTAMTLRMYAAHKKIDLRGVEVRVSHDKIHAVDCEHCETRAGKIDQFRRELRLDGDLDEAQRRRLVEIANRCPVHRTLHAEIDIQTTLIDD